MYIIDNIKKDLLECGNRVVSIKINNIRNKSEIINVTIKNLYARHFIVETDEKVIKSFSYADILTGNIELQGKKY